jgi:hypothetical protein
VYQFHFGNVYIIISEFRSYPRYLSTGTTTSGSSSSTVADSGFAGARRVRAACGRRMAFHVAALVVRDADGDCGWFMGLEDVA